MTCFSDDAIELVQLELTVYMHINFCFSSIFRLQIYSEYDFYVSQSTQACFCWGDYLIYYYFTQTFNWDTFTTTIKNDQKQQNQMSFLWSDHAHLSHIHISVDFLNKIFTCN